METFITGRKAVTTAGTPVKLGTNPVPNGVKLVIKARYQNTGRIYISNSSANALNSAGVAYELGADQTVSVDVDNLNDIWIDSDVNGEGVEYIFERQIS